MEAHSDFRELLELLNAHRVEYPVVGSYALAFHDAPRFTRDMDLLVRPTHANAERILAALAEFGFGSVGLAVEDVDRPAQGPRRPRGPRGGGLIQCAIAEITLDNTVV